ncbi:MAG TPA: hypothetical protein DDW76_09790 [Cyanobacteria bacterium UBA11369]|nr:hypothetical protein [Cyanobacteria bacterium UBA11371]HBE36131.1 hypothetical protein [Cyanobacteria bacterium UBA11368]HBE49064.1 hypothetical protein [Cyanobacteria bacterium UBA11369]
MSVVSSSKIIFCEGKQSSLDAQLLERVLQTLPTERPTIVTSGSKFTFSVFAQGYFFPQEIGNQRYLVFRDRDFDAKPSEEVRLIQLGSQRIWLTYRACIENYLLEPDLIDAYWREKYIEKQENPISKWGHGDSPGIDRIAQWIEAAARSLQEYQAVRWALGELLLTSTTRSQLKTTWTGGSGQLPSSLALQDCRTEALTLINQFRQAVETVTLDSFEANLATYQQQFNQVEFWLQKQYLIWFHGKDIQKEMQRQEPQYLSLKTFFNWAVTRIDIERHPDLSELRNKISQL